MALGTVLVEAGNADPQPCQSRNSYPRKYCVETSIPMKSTLLVLPLQGWMLPHRNHPEGGFYPTGHESVVPIIGRNGYYADRKTKEVWAEVNGKAWKFKQIVYATHPYDYFRFELEVLEAENNRLRPVVQQALSLLVKEGLATKEQLRLLNMECYIKGLDPSRFDGLKVKLRIKAFLEKKGLAKT